MAHYRRGWSTGWRKSTHNGREWYDSSWELQYMDELDRDALVSRWTRHHGLRVPYRKTSGARGMYEPDFLVELVDGAKELREVKGEHLFADGNTELKLRAGDAFCRSRGMKYRVVTKSYVDPAVWRPVSPVAVDESAAALRPDLGEDAYVSEPSVAASGTRRLVLIVVLAIIAAVTLILLCQ